MTRLTHARVNGIKSGYWSPSKKEELVQRLAAYEDTGLEPEKIKGVKSILTPKKPLERHYEDEGEPPYIKYCCPNGCRVQLIPPTGKGLVCETQYCNKCGQKIDWCDHDD